MAKRVTPELVRALSRWARPQMEHYQKVPALGNLELRPVRVNQQKGKLVFEATADVLPVHATEVKRWLKLYLLYDVGSNSIVRAMITIRGERSE